MAEQHNGIIYPEIITHVADENNPVMGKIANCTAVNFRRFPDKNAEKICVLNAGEEVLVQALTDNWAYIYTSAGIEGYVMKQFVEVSDA